MIIGIGVDICQVDRVAAMLERSEFHVFSFLA